MATYTWALLCLFRLTAGSLVGLVLREFGANHFVMIVGLSERAQRLGAELELSAGYGVNLVGFLADPQEPACPTCRGAARSALQGLPAERLAPGAARTGYR